MAYYEDINKRLDLQQGFLCNSLVELINNKYCIIGGHRGVTVFSKESIRIKVKKGSITIQGEELAILALTPEEVYISGIIKGIEIDEQR